MQEFFDFVNKHRANVLEGMVQKYLSIGPLLIKMESLVVRTNTGKSKMLKEYYSYWERQIFAALNHVCLPALTKYNQIYSFFHAYLRWFLATCITWKRYYPPTPSRRSQNGHHPQNTTAAQLLYSECPQFCPHQKLLFNPFQRKSTK